MKVNVKLDGMNHGLNSSEIPFISERPTIVFGADVCHSLPGSNTPSIAAVTASLDALAVCFMSIIRLQEARTDIISDIGNIVV